MAAWKAAESHARTVLLEREGSPGKKVCAEGVLADVLTDAEVKPSPEFVANEISGAFLYAPDEAKRVNVGGEGYILDKPAFLRVLAKRAEGAGAEARYSTTGGRIERQDGAGEIQGKEDGAPTPVRAGMFIGRAGTESIRTGKNRTPNEYKAVAAHAHCS